MNDRRVLKWLEDVFGATVLEDEDEGGLPPRHHWLAVRDEGPNGKMSIRKRDNDDGEPFVEVKYDGRYQSLDFRAEPNDVWLKDRGRFEDDALCMRVQFLDDDLKVQFGEYAGWPTFETIEEADDEGS